MKKLSLAVVMLLFLYSCQKETTQVPSQEEIASASNNNKEHGHLQQTKTFSSAVLFRWIDFQLLNLYKINASSMGGIGGARFAAWTGITAYESVVPGMPAYQSLSGQLTSLTGMPKTAPGFAYYWPECLNAALAHLTRARNPANVLLFPAPAGAEATQLLNIKNFSDGLYNEFISEGASVELWIVLKHLEKQWLLKLLNG